jgi:DNA polymerase (family 10)
MSSGPLQPWSAAERPTVFVVHWLRELYGRKVSTQAKSRPPGKILLKTAGSVRRRAKYIRDVDLVVVLPPDEEPPTQEDGSELFVFVSGDKKKQVWRYDDSINVELYFTPDKYLGSMMMHATGPREFNVKMRLLASRRGMTLSQWGLRIDDGSPVPEIIASRTEKDVFNSLLLDYIEPENRR